MEDEDSSVDNDGDNDSFAPTPPPPLTDRDRHNKHLGRTAYTRYCNKCGIDPSKRVLAMLGTNELVLVHRGIDKLQLEAIAAALKVNEQITCVNFSNNGLRPQNMEKFIQAMTDNEFVAELNLSQNYLSHFGAALVSNMIKNHKGLAVLKLSNCQFEDRDGLILRLGLEENDRIVELDLSKNTLEEDAGVQIGFALGANTSLRVLNLSWNNIRGTGGVALFKGIKRNCGLSTVDISWNGLGYEGAVAISDCLQHNNTLEVLDVTSNRINWHAIEVIAKGLRRNSSLKVLKIGHNPVTTTGALTLLQAVKDGISQLEHLDLAGVQVIKPFEYMANYIGERRRFTYDHDGVVPSHDVVGQKLERAMDPMRKVMNFLQESQIRPLELFRDFDKQQSGALMNMMFVERMRKAGLPLTEYEMNVILQQLLDDGPGAVEYKKLVRGIQHQTLLERREKYIEIQKEEELKKLHKKILTGDKQPQQGSKTLTAEGKLSTSMTRTPTDTRSLVHQSSSFEILPPIIPKTMAELEMADVPFLKTSKKKKKKGKKKKGRKSHSAVSKLF